MNQDQDRPVGAPVADDGSTNRGLWLCRSLRMLSLLLVVAAGAVFVAQFEEPSGAVIDHRNYQVAIDGVREGQSFYMAYEEGFREVYGPVPASRDFRFPTLYVLLAQIPGGSEFVAYAVMAVLAGATVALLARFPLSGVLVTLYILGLAVARTPSGPAAQYLYAESWVAPLVIAAAYSLRRGWHVAALALAVSAFSLREQGILLVAGIAGWLWFTRREWISGSVAVAVCTVGYTLHVVATRPFLDRVDGVHTPLHLGWNPVESFLSTVGIGLGSQWMGLLVVAGAVWWAGRHDLLLAMGPYLAIPFLTLWINRPYWGVMVLPAALGLAVDALYEGFPRNSGFGRLPGRESVREVGEERNDEGQASTLPQLASSRDPQGLVV